jgi:hypothetical protein
MWYEILPRTERMTVGIFLGVEIFKIEKADTSYLSNKWGAIPGSPAPLFINTWLDHDIIRSYDGRHPIWPSGVPETTVKLVMQRAHTSRV